MSIRRATTRRPVFKVSCLWSIQIRGWGAFNVCRSFSGLSIHGGKLSPRHATLFFPDLTGFDVVSVNLKAGDLLIFNSLLPHGIRPNRSFSQVRLAQYISMMPAPVNDHDLRARRIRSWRDLEPAPGFQRDPRYWEKKKAKRAKLTPLGKKLLGIESWL